MSLRFAVKGSYDPLTVASATFLFLTILFGGGGADAPFVNGCIEAIAALLLVAVVATHFSGTPLPRGAIGPVWFGTAVLLLIGLQLVPLPPEMWRGLPGRETAAAVTDLIGRVDSWRPVSLDPEATRRHAAALLVSFVIMLGGLAAPHRGLLLMARALVAAALVSGLLGGIQIATGNPDILAFHGAPAKGVATGVFANSNHQAHLMLAALVTTGLLIRAEPPQIKIRRAGGSLMIHLGWLLVPIFIALTVASQSRAGIALLIPATAAAMIIGVKKKGAGLLLMVLLGLVLAAIAIFTVTPGSVGRMMELQSMLLDDRAVFLPDLLYMLAQHWPWGSGLGTFVPAFQAIENLDLLQPLIVNHAHNDVLELLIEGGLPAAIMMIALAIAIAWRMVRLARLRRSTDAGPALAGFAIVVLLLLHSLVDYPLRTRSLAAVGAVAMVLMFSSAQQQLPTDKSPSAPKRQGFRRASAGPRPGLSRPPR